jgi:hypothetical protein
MTNAFEELRQRLDQKERELLQKCGDMTSEFISEMDQNTRLVKGRQTNMINAIDELTQQVKT